MCPFQPLQWGIFKKYERFCPGALSKRLPAHNRHFSEVLRLGVHVVMVEQYKQSNFIVKNKYKLSYFNLFTDKNLKTYLDLYLNTYTLHIHHYVNVG